ncbi:MAG: HAMP domain-containing histidine kinase [Lentisphaerae bacterium]|nr:HAMP domain-containing histidine kinase [Lentisphaerota bacterium]
MSWIKSPFFRSVKFRIAAVYASLLTVAVIVLFTAFFIYCKQEIYTLMDRDLADNVDRLSYEYLTGSGLPEGFVPVKNKRSRKIAVQARQEIGKDFKTLMTFENEKAQKILVLGTLKDQLKLVLSSPGKSIEIRDIKQVPDSEKNIAELTREKPENGRQYDYFWLYSADGRELFGSSVGSSDSEWIRKLKYKTGRNKVCYSIADAPRHRLRVAYRSLPDGKIMAAARSLHDFDSGIERLLIIYLSIAGGVLVLSFVCSYLIACRLCRGVDAVSAAANAVAEGDYTRRVKPRNSGSEIDRMMKNFNTMIGNTEKLMDELRTISDNIAHDLRTPLTRMLGRAELAVTGDMSREDYENAFAANAEECRRMLALINTMLDITRTESGTGQLHWEEFDLAKVLDQAIELFGMLAEQKNLSLSCRLPEMPVILQGDRMRLQQLIANLLDNAIKFTPENGRVDVSLQLESSNAILTVRDNGCGMSKEELEQVFKRFYRADSSRSLPGNGLGLSLVQAIVNAHKGSIEISSEPAEGTVVWVKLPLMNKN